MSRVRLMMKSKHRKMIDHLRPMDMKKRQQASLSEILLFTVEDGDIAISLVTDEGTMTVTTSPATITLLSEKLLQAAKKGVSIRMKMSA